MAGISMGKTQVDPKEVYNCGNYYSTTVSQNFYTIRMTAEFEGCNPSGFEALLLEPLALFLDQVAKPAVGEAFELAQKKMVSLGDGLISAAKAYGLTDKEAADSVQQTGGGHIAI
ncbi:hypothetical protein [Amycolatopsis panacis]|uniref:hypothetical protein n=1 Tax=Amycolatopsis panacis TaxID=2340917 RepID=UPI001313DC59|nr:hypothetical protein [Amycolatopsis panacis]